LECRRFKTRQNLQLLSRKINRVLNVEEARDLSNLPQIGLSESLLDDDVDQILADGVVRISKIAVKLDNTLS